MSTSSIADSPRRSRGASLSDAGSIYGAGQDPSASMLSVADPADMDQIENSVRQSKTIEDFTNIITEFRLNRQTLYQDSLAIQAPHQPHLHDSAAALPNSSSRQSLDQRSETGESTRCTCCCNKDDCPRALRARQEWRDLEADLRLSAEIGQALLRRHDAMQAKLQKQAEEYMQQRDGLMSRLTKSYKETSALERELAQSNLNLEAGDSSNRALLHELEEVRTQLSKLKVSQTKLTGADEKAKSVSRELEDLKQELAAERKRADAAESRCKKLDLRCSQLSESLKHARKEADTAGQHGIRMDIAEDALISARDRLARGIRHQHKASLDTEAVSAAEEAENVRVAEALIKDNESLRQDNMNLRNLLDACNEELASLRQVGSSDVLVVSSPNPESFEFAPSPLPDRQNAASSRSDWTAPVSADRFALQQPASGGTDDRNATLSNELSRPSHSALEESTGTITDSEARRSDIHTFDTAHFSFPPTSPTSEDSRPGFTRSGSIAYTVTSSAPSQVPESFSFAPSSRSSETSRDTEKVTADFLSSDPSKRDNRTAQLSHLVDYVNRLFTRLSTADVDTVSKRLQRQHLAGDAGHLARTTVHSILRDVDGLRDHFRKLIEQETRANSRDDGSAHSKDLSNESLVARKEFFALLKAFRDILCEMAKLRLCVNDIHLNPSNAAKLLQEHLGATAAEDRSLIPIPSAVNWLGKMLLGGPSAPSTHGASASHAPSHSSTADANSLAPNPARTARSTANRTVSGSLANHLAPRASPAVVSTAVAVEVKGSHASAAEGSKPAAIRSQSSPMSGALQAGPRPQPGRSTTSLTRVQSRNLSGLFAGSLAQGPGMSYDNLPRRHPNASSKPWQRPLSRIVDDDEISIHRGRAIRQQVFDEGSEDESDGEMGGSSTLLQRTLRPRGLSDSSIRSTFMEHAEGLGAVSPAPSRGRPSPISRIITPGTLSLHPSSGTVQASAEACKIFDGAASPSISSERSGTLTPSGASGGDSGFSGGAGGAGGVASQIFGRSGKVLSFFSGGVAGSGVAIQPRSATLGADGSGPTLRQTPSIAALQKAAARGAPTSAKDSASGKLSSGGAAALSQPVSQSMPVGAGKEGGSPHVLSASPRSPATSASSIETTSRVNTGLGIGHPRPGSSRPGF